MQKVVGKWLALVLLVVVFTGCGGQSKDELKPTLTLTGETQRTVSASSVVIEGQLSDNVKVASFTYSLNQGKAQDVMASLSDKAFTFTVDGLSNGENSIVITASDTAGNKTELELKITAFSVASTSSLSGTWGNQKIPYNFCGETTELMMVFYLSQEANQLTGSFKMGFSFLDNLTEGVVKATLQETNHIQGEITFDLKGQKQVGILNLQAVHDTLTGSITFKDLPQCEYTGTQAVSLKKDVDLPLPPLDDALEPNDSKEQASPINVNSSQDGLILNHSNWDWFTFTLDQPQTVTAKTTSTLNLPGRYIGAGLYDSQGQWVQYASSDNTTTSWVLKPGTYYLGLLNNSLATTTINYRLELSTQALANDSYEPNEESNQAIAINLPFAQTLSLTAQDQDWFSFDALRQGILDIQNPDDVQLFIYDSNLQIVERFYSGTGRKSYQVGLEPGRYYIQATAPVLMNEVKSYHLQLKLNAAPDQAFEPNNTQAIAALVMSGFANPMMLTSTDKDWFKFVLSETMNIEIDLGTHDPSRAVDVTLLAQNGTTLLQEGYVGTPYTRTLPAGTYYFSVSWPQYQFIYNNLIQYPFAFTVTPLPDSGIEPNNSFNTATPITLPYNQSLLIFGDDQDWFKFSVTSKQLLLLGVTPLNAQYAYYFNGELYDANGAVVSSFYSLANSNGLGAMVLEPGTYYLKLEDAYSSAVGKPYDLTLHAEALADSDLEPNNSMAQAKAIIFGFDREMVVMPNDEDWLKFTLSQTTQVKISLKSFTQYETGFSLLRENGENINYSSQLGDGGFMVSTPILSAGTYYLKMVPPYGTSTSKYQIKFEKN